MLTLTTTLSYNAHPTWKALSKIFTCNGYDRQSYNDLRYIVDYFSFQGTEQDRDCLFNFVQYMAVTPVKDLEFGPFFLEDYRQAFITALFYYYRDYYRELNAQEALTASIVHTAAAPPAFQAVGWLFLYYLDPVNFPNAQEQHDTCFFSHFYHEDSHVKQAIVTAPSTWSEDKEDGQKLGAVPEQSQDMPMATSEWLPPEETVAWKLLCKIFTCSGQDHQSYKDLRWMCAYFLEREPAAAEKAKDQEILSYFMERFIAPEQEQALMQRITEPPDTHLPPYGAALISAFFWKCTSQNIAYKAALFSILDNPAPPGFKLVAFDALEGYDACSTEENSKVHSYQVDSGLPYVPIIQLYDFLAIFFEHFSCEPPHVILGHAAYLLMLYNNYMLRISNKFNIIPPDSDPSQWRDRAQMLLTQVANQDPALADHTMSNVEVIRQARFLLATLHLEKALENKARRRYHRARCGLFPTTPLRHMHKHEDLEYDNAIKYFKLAASMGSEPARARLCELGWKPRAASAQHDPVLISGECATVCMVTPPHPERQSLRALRASQPELTIETQRLLGLNLKKYGDELFNIFIAKYVHTTQITDWLYLLQCARYLSSKSAWTKTNATESIFFERASRMLEIVADQDPALYSDQDAIDWNDTGIAAIKLARSMLATLYAHQARFIGRADPELAVKSKQYRRLAENIVLMQHNAPDKTDTPPHKVRRIG